MFSSIPQKMSPRIYKNHSYNGSCQASSLLHGFRCHTDQNISESISLATSALAAAMADDDFYGKFINLIHNGQYIDK